MGIDHTLNVSRRKAGGKGASGRLRSKSLVPGVYYTAGGENVMVQVPALPLEKLYEQVGHTTVFNLVIDDNGTSSVHPVIIWQVQRHPYKNEFLHIDYYGVDLDKEIRVDVPVEFSGTPQGVKLGGLLEEYREFVRLAGKPLDMPKKIVVDVSGLNINDSIYVADLQLPEHVHAVYDQNFAVASVVSKTSDADEEEEGEATAE